MERFLEMNFKFTSMGRIAELETDGVRFVFRGNEDTCSEEFSFELDLSFLTIDFEGEDFNVSFWNLDESVIGFLKSKSFGNGDDSFFEVVDGRDVLHFFV